MFVDNDLVLTDNAAVVATGNSTVVDLGATADWGIGNPLYLIVQITDAYTTGTLSVALRDSANEDGSSPTDRAEAAFTAAEVKVQGTRKHIAITPDTIKRRYVVLRYTVAGGLANGRISAWLSPTIEGYQTVESGFKVAK